MREAREHGDTAALVCLPIGMTALAWLVRDESDEAEREIAVSSTSWTRSQYTMQHAWALMARVQLDLYRGDGAAALRRLATEWPQVTRAHILRNRLIGVTLHSLRGRTALAAASGTAKPDLLALAERSAQSLVRTRAPWAQAFAMQLGAGIAELCGRKDEAATTSLRAAVAFDRAAMSLWAAAMRHRAGRLVGGEAGQVLCDESTRRLQAERIKQPLAMLRALDPPP
jgi:hypothetical protein